MAGADWDLRRLQQGLQSRPPAPLYVLHGDEIFLHDQALKAIKEKALSVDAMDFNFDSFIAPENSPTVVRDAVEQLPVMCERRLVVYKNVDALKDDAWEDIYPVIERPLDSATLVLVANKLDKRKKYVKRLLEKAVVVDLKKPFENQIPMWIDYISYLHEVKFTPEAVSALQELVGTNLSEINNEVHKIKQYVGRAKNLIDIDDVLSVVSRSRVESVFNLTDAIARRDRSQALICLANLLEHGQSEVGVMALIYRHIRILSAVHDGQKSGLSGGRLAQKVGVPEFFLKQYIQQARLWDENKIDQAIRALHETDKALKSSPISSHIWLENFIVKIC